MENNVKPHTFEEGVEEVLTELRDLLVRKQADYGHKNIMEFGEYGFLVRASDKVARLKNLLVAGKIYDPKNEPITDSWADLAGYAVIALMLDRGTFTLPLTDRGPVIGCQ